MVDLVLIGAGGLAQETLAVLRGAADSRRVGVLDDDQRQWGRSIDGCQVLGGLELIREHPRAQLLVSVGHGRDRARLVDRLGILGVTDDRYTSVVHGSVEVPASCSIGEGSILLAGVVLTADVVLGRHTVVMPHVTLTHGDRIDGFATLCAGVTLGGEVRIGTGAYLGMNAAVRQRLRIGAGATIGMGAAVVTDVPAHETWLGVPASRQTERVSA